LFIFKARPDTKYDISSLVLSILAKYLLLVSSFLVVFFDTYFVIIIIIVIALSWQSIVGTGSPIQLYYGRDLAAAKHELLPWRAKTIGGGDSNIRRVSCEHEIQLPAALGDLRQDDHAKRVSRATVPSISLMFLVQQCPFPVDRSAHPRVRVCSLLAKLEFKERKCLLLEIYFFLFSNSKKQQLTLFAIVTKANGKVGYAHQNVLLHITIL